MHIFAHKISTFFRGSDPEPLVLCTSSTHVNLWPSLFTQ